MAFLFAKNDNYDEFTPVMLSSHVCGKFMAFPMWSEQSLFFSGFCQSGRAPWAKSLKVNKGQTDNLNNERTWERLTIHLF